MRTVLDINWCGHNRQLIPWPESDDFWVLVPVVDAIANR